MKNHDDIWKQMTTPKEITVYDGDSFEWVKENFDMMRNDGVCIKCPMSGTIHNMPYRRSISKSMARSLKLLYRIQVERINDGTTPNSIGDFTKLRYWNLIRQDDAGYWRITDTGIGFVSGFWRIKKYVIVLNNECVQFMGDDLTINDILNK